MRKTVLAAAGIAIILLATGAILLPLAHDVRPRAIIGPMLLAAGLVELASAALRVAHRPSATIAAGATVLAGVRLLLDSDANFFAVLNLVILWLVVRSTALLFASFRSGDSMTDWLRLSAATDFILAVALLAGLPVALLVVGLFGPTTQIIATFAWIFAISFIATGVMLIAASRQERPAGQ